MEIKGQTGWPDSGFLKLYFTYGCVRPGKQRQIKDIYKGWQFRSIPLSRRKGRGRGKKKTQKKGAVIFRKSLSSLLCMFYRLCFKNSTLPPPTPPPNHTPPKPSVGGNWHRARLSRLATRYVHIVPHYRTPLSYPTIRSWLRDVAFIDPSRFKIKALCLPAVLTLDADKFDGLVPPTRMLVPNHWAVLFVCEVQNSFAFIDHFETWFWLYVTYKTHLFASLDMPISKDVWKRLCVYLLLNLPERRWETWF